MDVDILSAIITALGGGDGGWEKLLNVVGGKTLEALKNHKEDIWDSLEKLEEELRKAKEIDIKEVREEAEERIEKKKQELKEEFETGIEKRIQEVKTGLQNKIKSVFKDVTNYMSQIKDIFEKDIPGACKQVVETVTEIPVILGSAAISVDPGSKAGLINTARTLVSNIKSVITKVKGKITEVTTLIGTVHEKIEFIETAAVALKDNPDAKIIADTIGGIFGELDNLVSSAESTIASTPEPEDIPQEPLPGQTEFKYISKTSAVIPELLLIPSDKFGGVSIDYAASGSYSIDEGGKLVLSGRCMGLGEGCFRGIQNLRTIEIPEEVADLGDYTFWNCTDLTSIKLNQTRPPKRGDNIVDSGVLVYVPHGYLEKYKSEWPDLANVLRESGS